MTNLPSFSTAPSRRSKIAVLLTLISCGLLWLAVPAGAVVVKVGEVTAGVSPRVFETEGLHFGEKEAAATYANPAGNPVLHGEGTYAIYWDPTDHYHGDWQYVIDGYLHDVAADSGDLSNVFAVDAQYTDKTNAPASYHNVFHGAYTDTTAYPASGCTDPAPLEKEDLIGALETPICLTSAQVATELQSFLSAHGLPTGMNSVYYVMTPPAVTVCLDAGGATGHCSDFKNAGETYENSFCSYHSAINPGGLATGDGNTILYGMIPWTAGGWGDVHLSEPDEERSEGWECQDGGFDPSNGEEFESVKPRNAEEQKAFEEMNEEEQEEAEEERLLKGPHAQEPNQLACPTADGGCDTGLADMVINQLSLQQQNIITNPLLNAWQDAAHNENTDECRFFLAPSLGGSVTAQRPTHAGTLYNQEIRTNHYYLNNAFNLAASRLPYPGVPCMHNVNLVPQFTAPSTVNSLETVGLNGMESNITLDAAVNYPGGGSPASNYATYEWNFGDGTVLKGYAPGAPACTTPWLSPCAASAFHAYTYGGTYTVTLTVVDVGGNVQQTSHEITVVGPAPPVPAPAPGAAGSGSTPPGGSGTPLVAAVTPVAEAAVISRSLKTVLKKGLSIRYSVNEQVAGRFEVLISSALAKKLKLHGTPATGLPAGTPPQVMIAKSILVTTKAGRATVQIKFPSAVAARLRHAHKVPLLLRMYVRNAASKSPETTTVLSSVTLG